jgi:hypothetical protein
MVRNSILVLAALAGWGVSGCSARSSLAAFGSGEKGQFDLSLVVGGETIDSVHMSLTSPALPSSIERDIDTSKVTGSVKAFAGLLPIGTYNVSFGTTTIYGLVCSGSGGPFTVAAGATVSVSVPVVCGANGSSPSRGNATIRADVTIAENCPYMTEVFAAPVQVEVGGTIDLSAKVNDPAGTVFSWSAMPATGTFGPDPPPNTTFTATAAGLYTLTATLDRAGCATEAVNLAANFITAQCLDDFPCWGKASACVFADQIVYYEDVQSSPGCTTCRPILPPVPCPAGTVCVATDQPNPFLGPNGACVAPPTGP